MLTGRGDVAVLEAPKWLLKVRYDAACLCNVDTKAYPTLGPEAILCQVAQLTFSDEGWGGVLGSKGYAE